MARAPSPPCRLVAAAAALALLAGGWVQSAQLSTPARADGEGAQPLRSFADGFPPVREP
jgi:hypothetical protein